MRKCPRFSELWHAQRHIQQIDKGIERTTFEMNRVSFVYIAPFVVSVEKTQPSLQRSARTGQSDKQTVLS